MKILVPTDFSEASKVAVNYGAAFAAKTNNPMILMNNLSADTLPRAGVLINLEQKIEINTMEDLTDLAKNIESSINPAPDIFCELSHMSSDAQGIIAKADEASAGIIVLGSKGASGFANAILGSVSMSVIRSSSIPVIVVPLEATFTDNGAIIFAVDVNTIPTDQTLMHYDAVCKLFDKVQEYLFADTIGNESKIAAFKNKLKDLFPTSSPVFHTLPDNDPVHAINEFTQNNTCMLLALSPGTHNIFDRIMGKSVTTKLIAHSNIPVLALP